MGRNFRNSRDNAKSELSKDDNTKRSTNGRRPSSNSKSKKWDKDKRSVDTTDSRINDPGWYAANLQLLLDSASISYNNASGSGIPLGTAVYGDGSQLEYMPGIMAIKTMPSVGISADNTSPVNVAATNIYGYVRYANAGHTNYDTPDLMIYLLAMDNIYSMYSYMVRAYGVMRLTSIKNRYLPRTLITAMGLDYDSFDQELADFRYFINSCAVKIGSMCTPSSMPYFLRHMWMYQGIYADDMSTKAQLYLYTPEIYYVYQGYTDKQGGILKANKLDAATTFAQLRTIMTNMINAVVRDQDMNIMSGDILKAFGTDGIFKIGMVPEDYVVIPQYSPEVLTQVQNTTLLGYPRLNTGLDITQDANTVCILHDPTFYTAGPGRKGGRVLNQYVESPSPADTMVATRLMVCVRSEVYNSSDTFWDAQLDSCASDLACYATIYSFKNTITNGNRDILVYNLHYVGTVNLTVPSSVVTNLDALSRLEKFDKHPSLRTAAFSANPQNISSWTFSLDFMDVDNFTVIQSYELKKMHETALLSMWQCPQMGAFKLGAQSITK